MTINGRALAADAEPDTPLLWVLRDTLDLIGTTFGCGGGFCGACTVHVNGTPRRSCTIPVSQVASAAITTIEGAVRRRHACRTARVGGDRRAAVRLLPGGPDHDGGGAPGADAESVRRIVIHKVTAVADVGQPVNLAGLEAQGEGGIIDGLNAAFFGNVPIERGRATVANFDSYRLIRNREAPAAIDVTFVASQARPTGFGEIAVPPVAPAVANAVAALTGRRIRRMPFSALGFDLAPSRR